MKKISRGEWVVNSVLFLVASIIVSFGFLKFLPLSFGWTWIMAGAAFVWWVWHTRKTQLFSRLSAGDIPLLLLFFSLAYMFGRLYFTQLVPSGTDMATHSYIAAAIRYHEGFPTTYEPLVPLSRFGFEPIGMGVLIAAVSDLTGIPIFRASLLASVLVYPAAGAVIFTFLRLFFSRWAAFLTTAAAFFIDADLTSYVGWGAHPTVLSVLLFAMGTYWLIRTFQWKQFTIQNAGIAAVMLSASLLTHPTPFLAGAYFLLLPAVWSVFRFKNNASFHRFILTILVGGMVCTASFWSSLQPVSDHTYQWLENFQRQHVYIMIDITHLPSAVVSYLAKESGPEWTTLVFIGFALSIARKKEAPWFLAGFLVYATLMINTHFWKLPFSPALYPDRVHTTALIIFCYFVAVALDQLLIFFRGLIYSKNTSDHLQRLFFLGALIFFVSKPIGNIVERRYEDIFFLFRSEIFVSEDDRAVFEYLKNNSSQTDIVANNYGDAGIWIPAIAERMVTNNDAVPHSFEELNQRQAQLKPTYAFISGNPVYPEKSTITEEWTSENNFQLIFQSGESKLYKKH